MWPPRCLRFSTEPSTKRNSEDNLAEKLRALLLQPIRNRSRPQDVYDIASRFREFGGTLDLAKISEFLLKKAQARNIQPTKSSFDESVRSRAAAGYDTQIRAEAPNAFIPLEEAWPEVLGLVSRLTIPD
jgi:Nucleotidyl transferase AbiEii toxin, Type IV TA system